MTGDPENPALKILHPGHVISPVRYCGVLDLMNRISLLRHHAQRLSFVLIVFRLLGPPKSERQVPMNIKSGNQRRQWPFSPFKER